MFLRVSDSGRVKLVFIQVSEVWLLFSKGEDTFCYSFSSVNFIRRFKLVVGLEAFISEKVILFLYALITPSALAYGVLLVEEYIFCGLHSV